MENAPFWLKRIFLSLFPKPSISIFLYNSPEILHNRRPEESVNELERQMKIFRKFDYSLELKSTDEKKDSTTTVEFVTTHLLRNWQ